jgi:hypothetical protein
MQHDPTQRPSQGSATGHHHRHGLDNVPAKDLPRRGLTPGVVLTERTAKVCVSDYATSVRDVSQSTKDTVYSRYGVAYVPYAHEVDHLISLELGGSNSIRNLWPEPYAGRWGARTKDTLENRLHDIVCAGQLRLVRAQSMEAHNWVRAYRRFVGAPPRAGSTTSSTSGGTPRDPGGFYASSYASASTIYCADDSEWKALSPTYLVHFSTWSAALRRFPDYHLHRPC